MLRSGNNEHIILPETATFWDQELSRNLTGFSIGSMEIFDFTLQGNLVCV